MPSLADSATAADELHALLDTQRRAFRQRGPLAAEERRAALGALRDSVLRRQDDLVAAVSRDFGQRAADETRMLELLPLAGEIAHIRRKVAAWMRPRAAPVNWQFWPSRARIHYQPRGVVGVIGAWNYPILLTLSPAINALAAGNHVMIKPSELAPATADLLADIIVEAFPPHYVTVVRGDTAVAAAFSALPFDHLIFTGSTRVGRLVMKAAADHLTPVTLELGGKSPAIVHGDYDLDRAADRILSSKLWNSGQTCIAPDYALIPATRMEDFAVAGERVIRARYPRFADNPDYTRMITPAAWTRMQALIDDARDKGARIVRIAAPNESFTAEQRAFAPTLVIGANRSMQVMQEEIFGPVLPLVGYDSLEEAIGFINDGPRPLSLYYFDDNGTRIAHVLDRTISGGVTINDCMFHMPQHALPFGGVGPSGIGAYHGFAGFETFSHRKGVLIQNGLVGGMMARFTKPPYAHWARLMTARLIGTARAAPRRFDPLG